jgi:hypothetical protein
MGWALDQASGQWYDEATGRYATGPGLPGAAAGLSRGLHPRRVSVRHGSARGRRAGAAGRVRAGPRRVPRIRSPHADINPDEFDQHVDRLAGRDDATWEEAVGSPRRAQNDPLQGDVEGLWDDIHGGQS